MKKKISVICHINKITNTNHIIISRNLGKAFDKKPTPFHEKTFDAQGIDRNVPMLINAIYGKPTANILLNGKGRNAVLVRAETGQRYWLLMPLFHIVLKVFSQGNQKTTKTKTKMGIQIRKEKGKLSLFADHMILHIENPRNPLKNIRSNKWVQKGCRIQDQFKNQLYCYTLTLAAIDGMHLEWVILK